MNEAILKSLYSGISNSYERHSKYRFPERYVCLFQRCKHWHIVLGILIFEFIICQ